MFKICLIGSGGVGKTCIAQRLCFNTFNANTQMTIGIDFYTHEIPLIIDGAENFVRIAIWDFGGQEQFKKLFSYYIDGANGIFLVFDLSNIDTLLRLSWWYEQLRQYNLHNRPKILIGTKLDLVQEINKKEKIDELVIRQFLSNHNEKDFVRTSSKENVNILQIFKEMLKKILDSHALDYDTIL
jgi:small GTP-binding protein